MIEVVEYLDEGGRSPFASWFKRLNPQVAARITVALDRMTRGLMGDVEPVGDGVTERRLDFGPGYRLYFGSVKEGHTTEVVILLCGGTKKRQRNDIEVARARWKAYKRRKRNGEEKWH